MRRCWLLTDGSAGMLAQARALAEALGLSYEAKKITLSRWFSWQPNAFYAIGFKHLILDYALDKKNSDSLELPWPEIVISCGRRAALIAMGMRWATMQPHNNEQAKDDKQEAFSSSVIRHPSTFFIHIQDPQCRPENFDLVIAMEHDKLQGANVISVQRALHSITPEKLAAAREQLNGRFSTYTPPKVAVLLGGSTNKYRLKPQAMKQIISKLEQLLARTSCSLLITPSRRTGEDNVALLESRFRGHPRVYLYDGKEENPYLSLLAHADYIITTNDSVNMMSEALATKKPLYILPLPGHRATKPARFAERLIQEGAARLLGDSLQPWSYEIKDEMKELAVAIKLMLPSLRVV
ncbi:MAG: mitochondrial fission ELM1 family protein [Alphaproteobacteria bacterium]|nr:mitochondrial fission ELM1 family protein [Alphaproteobacteria bacterium]